MATEATYDYDYVVIGGGSGGLASAKRAAINHGKKVAVIERKRWGGTCVNVGCVPKKIMFCAATLSEMMKHDVVQYSFPQPSKEALIIDWAKMKEKRDAYIVKLNGIYERGLSNNSVTRLIGDAKFSGTDPHSLDILQPDGTTKTITADKILIAVGGRPDLPPGLEGVELCDSSDEFFEWTEMPKKVVVAGAGYIAVELAGVLNGLGSDVHLVVRKGKALRNFDEDISDQLDKAMLKGGITIHRNTNGLSKVIANGDLKEVHLKQDGGHGTTIEGVDKVLLAIGRVPNTDTLGLDKIGVELVPGKTYIQADDFQNTSVPNIFALGDVCGKVELTPMAIAAGRRLSDRIFGGVTHSKAGYDLVPTVVFSHPPIGTCGMTEAKAVEKYGQDNIKVYKSNFVNLYYGIFAMESEDKPRTFMKVITAGADELVVGIHLIGMGSDEMLQGFGVAMKMGCTKSDLDSCVAIHPTAAEELVTMGTWGTAPEATGAKHSPLMGAPPSEPKLSK